MQDDLQQPAYPPSPNQPGELPTSGMAIAGLICGALAFVPVCGAVFALAGLIMSLIGLSAASQNRRSGMALAIIGVVLSVGFGIMQGFLVKAGLNILRDFQAVQVAVGESTSADAQAAGLYAVATPRFKRNVSVEQVEEFLSPLWTEHGGIQSVSPPEMDTTTTANPGAVPLSWPLKTTSGKTIRMIVMIEMTSSGRFLISDLGLDGILLSEQTADSQQPEDDASSQPSSQPTNDQN